MGCSKAKQAESPEDAVHLLEASMRDGDFDQRISLAPKRQRGAIIKLRDTFKNVKKASDAFYDALDVRFGSDSLPKRPETPDLAASFEARDQNARIEIANQERKDDNSVNLKLKMTRTENEKTGSTNTVEVNCTAIKEDDGWKLYVGSEENAESKQQKLIEMLERQIKFFEQGAADVKAGKYQTKIEAIQAFRTQPSGNS